MSLQNPIKYLVVLIVRKSLWLGAEDGKNKLLILSYSIFEMKYTYYKNKHLHVRNK
jgi:hypothetical protein